MRTRHLFFIGALAILASCSNDNDFFPCYNDDCNWESSLGDIITDNKDVFAYYDIEITDIKIMKDLKVDSALFFDGKYGYFPVYSKKDSVLEVIKYEDVDKQNKEYGFNKQVVNDIISKLLNHADDYDIIQLTWRLGSERFNSLALFNKRTGELEYDNMLFNMSTISKYDSEKFILIMRSSETPPVSYSGSRTVKYSEGINVVATASVSWSVWGHWNTYTNKYNEDDHYEYYATYYTFCYDSARIVPSSNSQYGYDTFISSCNNSVPLQPRYEIAYAIWAGPIGGFRSSYFNIQLMDEVEMQYRIEAGNGLYEKIQDSPRRDPTFFEVPKH